MAGSADIRGAQHYVLGIGHPKSATTTEAPPVVPNIDVSGNIATLKAGTTNIPFANRTTGNKVAILGNSITAQALPIWAGLDSGWANATTIATNAYRSPSVYDLTKGYIPLRYQATTGGTTGLTEPIWPTSVGGTVTDGTVVWTAVANSAAPYWQPSWWHLAQGLSGQRLREIFIAGRSGKTSDDILLYLDRALAANPDIVYFANMFENDVWPGAAPSLATVASSWAAVSAAMDRCLSLGKRVMVNTVLPNGSIDGSSLFTGYVRGNGTKAWQWLNAQILAYVRSRPDVILVDVAQAYVDPNPANPVWPENTTTFLSNTGTGQQLKRTDGVHPYGSGGWAIAQILAPVLSFNFQAVSNFGTAADVNALSKNPLNGGTGGSAGTNTTGTIAASMTLNTYGTGTGAATIVARTDISGNWQQLAASYTQADNVDYSTGAIPLNSFAVGDLLQGFAEIKVLANPTMLRQLQLRMDYTGGSPNQVFSGTDAGGTAQDLGQLITTDTLFTVKTVPMKTPTGTTDLRLYSRAVGRNTAVAAAWTIQFGRSCIRDIEANPALA